MMPTTSSLQPTSCNKINYISFSFSPSRERGTSLTSGYIADSESTSRATTPLALTTTENLSYLIARPLQRLALLCNSMVWSNDFNEDSEVRSIMEDFQPVLYSFTRCASARDSSTACQTSSDSSILVEEAYYLAGETPHSTSPDWSLWVF